jgi:sigma-B regulation protein RsbU (phosphoserine phosphatase)
MDDKKEIARLRREIERSRRLADASYALHTTLDLDELLGLILDAAKAGVAADRGTVFLVTEDGKELWSRVLTGDGAFEIRLPIGKGIAGTVAATGEAVRLADARKDPRFDASWDEKSGYVTRQLLTAPIRHREGKVIGVFQLLNKQEGDFEDKDEEFLEALSVHAALAVENARLHKAALEKERQDREIGIARDVQRAFQPERQERSTGCLRAAGLNFLCEDASGDYYDFFDLPDGRLAAVVGDVSGHGLGSAIVMAQARSLLRAYASTVEDLSKVMTLLNDHLADDIADGRFMSLFVAIADPASGEIEWHSTGHPPGMLRRAATGEVESLASLGRVLGILPGASYPPARSVRLEQGDVLLLYTDGATEARDASGEMLEEEGLAKVLGRLAEQDPSRIVDGVRAALVEWTGKDTFDDDLTLVAVKRGA